MAACLTMGMCTLTGCSDDTEKSSTKTDSSSKKTDQKDGEDTTSLPEFQVKKASGNYAKLSKKEAADGESEEIMDLVNEKHIIDETFDATEYATNINEKHEGKWGIYIYMCGSNLESEGGAATTDIQEMLDSQMSEDVNIVIQTGGSKAWQNEMVSADYLERYLVSSEGIEQVDQQDSDSMGKQETLTDFLTYCDKNYPAENQMVIFWNHGGGSLGGACYDELYGDDHLTLNEINQAFDDSFGEKRISAIGFDCCLMASIDTANICKNHAEIMIASEETEPGNGWYYTDWLTDLSEKPAMSNADLGKSICDAYMTGCEAVGTEDETTLSVIDLNKINLVVDSVNSLSTELFTKIVDDASIMTKLGRAASKAENYGGNTASSGYFDLVDIGDFMKKAGADTFETKAMIDAAMESAVVYNVHGSLRSKSTGISMYFPYDKNLASQQKYESVAASDLYAGVNRLMLTGDISQDTIDLFSIYCEQGGSEEQTTENVSADALADSAKETGFTNDGKELAMTVDDDGYLNTQIDPKDMANVASVTAELMVYLEDQDTYLSVGVDNDVTVDWDQGSIKDNFRGVWACLDGHYLYLDLCYEGDDYNLYNVPIKLNGEDKDMTLAYYYESNTYEIIGVSDSVDDQSSNQCATKATQNLKKGDKITTIFYYYDYDAEEWKEFELETFKYKDNMKVTEEDLGDGEYALMFMTDDVQGNTVYSQYGFISYKNGDIEAYVEE